MSPYRIYFIAILLCVANAGLAQGVAKDSVNGYNLLLGTVEYIRTDSGLLLKTYKRTSCKSYTISSKFLPAPVQAVKLETIKPPVEVVKAAPKLLTIHGNIAYDFFYRSKIDTPVNLQNFQQHTERVYLDILVKEKYPLKLNFTSRQSNSLYFKDFVDINFNFDRYGYNNTIRQQILDKLKSQLPVIKYPEAAKASAELKKIKDQYNQTKSWLEDPGTLQKIIEERERTYFVRIRQQEGSMQRAIRAGVNWQDRKDTVAAGKAGLMAKEDSVALGIKDKLDSGTAPFAKLYESKKAELDSLEKQVAIYKAKADSLKIAAQRDVAGIQQKIYKASSEKELRQLAKENGIDIGRQSKLEKQLSAIKTLGIGRSVLNYTELTAQNITVTGLNVEYNPSYYAAFSAGKIDYRFRDFYNRHAQRNDQYIVMGRLGLGDKEHKALIFSYFTGRKTNTIYGLSDSSKNSVDIMGYSLQAILKKDEHTSISAEFAKSTKPVTGNLQANKQTGTLVKFNDPTNTGINIKAQTIIPETNTKLSGFYRKTGQSFQSFSLFSYNADQTAWLARADQTLFKNRVALTGMLRRNDFSNPFTEKTYKTSTVFKSIQASVRFPKYPSLSVGYYPGTQLYLVDKEKLRESAYYILNGSVIYSYYIKGLAMNSSVIYNKYTSEATDSGFVGYKGTNYYVSQSVFLRKLQLQGGYAYNKQPLLEYYTLESSGDYKLQNWLNIGVGAKYNNITGGNNYWGESMQLRADLKKIGGIQLQYEKSYLPTITQTLYPVEIGRVSYYKNF